MRQPLRRTEIQRTPAANQILPPRLRELHHRIQSLSRRLRTMVRYLESHRIGILRWIEREM